MWVGVDGLEGWVWGVLGLCCHHNKNMQSILSICDDETSWAADRFNTFHMARQAVGLIVFDPDLILSLFLLATATK